MIVVAARISFFQFAKKENYKKQKKKKGIIYIYIKESLLIEKQ